MAKRCDVGACNKYSDVDVYYSDGTSENRCSKHAWEISDDDEVEQIVPQHRSDEINQPIKE